MSKHDEIGDGKLSKKDLHQMFRRWIFSAGLGWNYETQQAPSVAFAMAKVLRKIYPNDEDYIEAMDNHYKYYNATAQMGNIILGATLAMEEKDGLAAKDAVQSLKTSLMGPFSGIGDSIFWVIIPTILGSISGYMALQGNPLGAIIWIIITMLMYFLKMWMFKVGYISGTKLITVLGEKINIFTDALSAMGLMVVGTLIATAVKVYTPVEFKFGKVTLALQTGVFDQIMPCLLPACLAGVVYWLLGKKFWTPTRVILLVIIVSLIGSATGILGIAPAK